MKQGQAAGFANSRITSYGRYLAVAIAFLTVLMLVTAPGASAVPSAPPEITATPSNPNTTHAVSHFEFEVGEGETSTVTPLRFYCRAYSTDNPPAPGNGWVDCGTTAEPAPHFWNVTLTTNGSKTFDVALRETTAISTQGPIATHQWVQNLPAPSGAPVFTSQPDNPSTSVVNSFEYEPASGEEALVTFYECRLDSTDEDDWTKVGCGLDGADRSPGNGEHTFQVRAGNAFGTGPARTSFWTVEVPNPEPSVKAGDVAVTRWDGGTSGSIIGASAPTDLEPAKTGMRAVGDINGDGRGDIAVADRSDATESGGVYVLNTTANGAGVKNLAQLQPADGYRIRTDQVGTYGVIPNISPLGDQNGDGVPEVIVSYAGDPSMMIAVVYGVSDPSDLPQCNSPAPTRCLDTATMTDEQGYFIIDSNFSDLRFPYGVGDIDDDGIDDLAIGASYSSEIYLIAGGARTETIDLADPGSLPAGETERLFGDPDNSYSLGQRITNVGDLNDDGFDDIAFSGNAFPSSSPIPEALFVMYGHALGGDPVNVAELGPPDGFRFSMSGGSAPYAVNVGDSNGDGRDDLAIGVPSILGQSGSVTIFYMPEDPPVEPILVGDDMTPGTGYVVGAGGESSGLGSPLDVLGDFDNDGRTDLLAGAPLTPADGVPGGGAAYVLFGQSGEVERLEVGQQLNPDIGVALIGSGSQGPVPVVGEGTGPWFGSSVAQLGDLDGDGLTDFAVGAEREGNNGMNNSGSVYLILGKSLINQVKTSNANGTDNDSAVLNAGISTNDRATDVHFEYGTSTEYGQETPVQELPASNSGDAASVEITGLTKNTAYHYRAVATNELGLTRYGDDKTFTTTNTSGGGGGSNCDTDNTLPGCSSYDYCKSNPGKCSTAGPAKLSTLVLAPRSTRIKRGKKGSLTAVVANAGGQTAEGVKLCVKAPKKFVKVKKCLSIGALGAGQTAVKTIKVKATKKAKRGKKLTLKFTASGNGLASQKASATIKVK